MENNVLYLKEEVKLYEREILKMLLQISESFSDINFTKTQRDDCFARIDSLREKVKDIINLIGSIDKEKKEKEFLFDSNVKEKIFNVESADNSLNFQVDIDKIKNISEDEVEKFNDLQNENKEENSNDFLKDLDGTSNKIDTADYTEEILEEIKRQDNEHVEKDIIFQNKRKGREIFDSNEELLENNFSDLHSKLEVDRLDKLIEEAKTLNSVSKTINDSKNYEDIEKLESQENLESDVESFSFKEDIIQFSKVKADENGNEQEKSYSKTSDDLNTIENFVNPENNKSIIKSKDMVEPVPVLFGNRRVNNQMVIRKRNTGFKDKIKTLIFKIKKMLGDKNEK